MHEPIFTRAGSRVSIMAFSTTGLVNTHVRTPWCLFNIGSGKAASNKAKEFLLNVASIGKEMQEQFIKESSQNSNRFENEAIRRTKMDTFATEGAKRIVKSNDKLKEFKME